MDLFGEHSVQVVAAIAAGAGAMLESALVLTLATLLVLLSVRVAQRSALKPMLAIVPQRMSRIVPPGRDVDVPSARRLSRSLPTRAPPLRDPFERFRPAPPGASRSRAHDGLGAHVLRA